MFRSMKSIVKLVFAFIIIMIAISLVGRLVKLAVELAILGGVGYGLYLGAKKLNLIKG